MKTLWLAGGVMTAVLLWSSAGMTVPGSGRHVTLLRVPDAGIQPDVVLDKSGVMHALYFRGDAAAGDLFYVRSSDDGATFSTPVRVNSQEGSAIATGTIRGGHLAVGANGRIHVGWNGSNAAFPRGPVSPANPQANSPFLYTRSNPRVTAFEPQRNLIQRSYALDGGGSIAADVSGHVYAAWHAPALAGVPGEEHRVVWIAQSSDEGATFSAERPAWQEPTGACGCCGLTLFSAPSSALFLLYRSATAMVHRDMYLLESTDSAGSFRGSRVHPWEIGACAMTSSALAASGSRVFAAWETAGQVYCGEVDPARAAVVTPVAAPRNGGSRKHPRLAVNPNGEVLLVWTEGTAWARGGSFAWQLFDTAGHATDVNGESSGIPMWSFAAPVALRDGRFVILH